MISDHNEPEGKRSPRTPPHALPSAEQLQNSRATHWHQDENPLLSQEAIREWIARSGLVVYGPRAAQLGAPAPSLVETTLGKKLGPEVDLAGAEAAKTLLARLVAEGSAVPLNLLGASGGLGTDVPDFVASAAVFSYIFTLRGNKAWRQLPVTAGPVKVSPLALAVYEMLTAKVMLSAYDLATQLGKEVTEGAVLRALTELWSQLRVIPVPQLDGTATLWELTSERFTKQIKAGANAGQPSALSALISLYLGQAVAATEDEIETFLSPLAPRSRLRDVIHALLAARQLETIVVEGKTLLHIAGGLPGFATVAPTVGEAAATADTEIPGAEGSASRISKFASKQVSKIGTGLRAKRPFGSKPKFGKNSFGGKPAYGAKPASGTDRERRPFKRDAKPGFDKSHLEKPRFDKPWTEDRKPRPDAAGGFAASADNARPPRREYIPRPRNAEGTGAPRKTFSKPGTFGRKREGFGGKPDFDRPEGRPPRHESAEGPNRPRPDRSEPDRPAPGGFKRTGGAARSYAPRPRSAFGGKPSFGVKPFAGRPGSSPGRSQTSSGQTNDRGEAPRKVYRKFDAPRDKKPFMAKPAFGAKPLSLKKFADRPAGDRPARTFDRPHANRGERPEQSSFSTAPNSKKPFAKAGGPFVKFAEGKKPFRKPGPGKKSPSGKPDGGYKPVKRKRPEGSA